MITLDTAPLASYHVRFPCRQLQRKPLVSDPGMCHARVPRTCRDACRDNKTVVDRKTFPAFPVHTQPAVLRI